MAPPNRTSTTPLSRPNRQRHPYVPIKAMPWQQRNIEYPGDHSFVMLRVLRRKQPKQVVQWLSSQICNVCSLLETGTKFGVLVDMVAAMSSGYRTTSTAPPGGWWRHILNVSTWCHINVHNFVSKRIFSFCFQIYIQEMFTRCRFNIYQHFSK